MGKLSELQELKKQLQKTFTILKEFTSVIHGNESHIKSKLKSIRNLTEQLLSCRRVKDSDFPAASCLLFKDVQERLTVKLTDLITEDLSGIKQILHQQIEYSERLSKQYEACVCRLGSVNNQRNILLLTERTALRPSISEMLEMLHWCECRIRQSCLAKMYIIEEFDPDHYGEEESLEKAWYFGDKTVMEQIQDYLLITSFFMEEKIT